MRMLDLSRWSISTTTSKWDLNFLVDAPSRTRNLEETWSHQCRSIPGNFIWVWNAWRNVLGIVMDAQWISPPFHSEASRQTKFRTPPPVCASTECLPYPRPLTLHDSYWISPVGCTTVGHCYHYKGWKKNNTAQCILFQSFMVTWTACVKVDIF